MTAAQNLPFAAKPRKATPRYRPDLPPRYRPWQLVLARDQHHLNTEMLRLSTLVPSTSEIDVRSIFGDHGYKDPFLNWNANNPDYTWVGHNILLGDREANANLLADLLPYAFIRAAP